MSLQSSQGGGGAALAGRFDILRAIGGGAFGAVYEAFDRTLRRRVALKRLIRVDEDGLYRFKREFRSLPRWRTPTWCGCTSCSPTISTGGSPWS